ncbi:ABATE domain-containing protein [Streptomyces sp. NPDC051976]|uniref:CGNR zinc finger domain-containing protein n=1 Tax=Streptomyces sp. NPDC051976 TaxID=3154947 RepID=UPI0034374131
METTEPQNTEPVTTEPVTDAPLFGEPLPVELMNTVWADRDGVHDALLDADGLARWLVSVRPRLPVGPAAGGDAAAVDDAPSPALLGEFRQLRDALRRLAAVATDDTRPAASSATPDLTAAVDAVNHACAYAPAWSRLDWPEGGAPTRTGHSAHSRAATALSGIAEEATRLFTGDARSELRACHAPGCVLYFVRSHPRREWCSAACGNRARVARHYQRHHAGSAPR